MRTVCIVGAGPCGLATAIAIEEAGVHAIVFDRSCVVSAIAGYPTDLTFFSTPERLQIGGIPFAAAGERPTRREGLAYYRSVVEHHGLTVRQYEDVVRIEQGGDGFTVYSLPSQGGQAMTHASAVVIATGYFGAPNMLGVPGEDLPHVTHRFREGHEAFQRDAVVVGGGNSAVECALDLSRSGARVTLVHFASAFTHIIKPWILPEFEQRVRDGAIAVRWNARVMTIQPACVQLQTDAGPASLPAQHVYLMTGYTPTPGLLGALGVPFDPETGVPSYDPATMETPVRGVFVGGVLIAGHKANGVFIENGRGHGALIARALT